MITERQLNKAFYQAMRVETKNRKIKLSAEHDIYKKVDPYFFDAHYFIWGYNNTDCKVRFSFDISVKYHRFDELQYSIIHPGDDFHFTDKIRANSGALCHAAFPRIEERFDFDGNEESLPELAAAVLNYLAQYIRSFLVMVEKEYGDLDEYYIANVEKNPRLAGLACLDKGDYESAVKCFMHPNMDGESSSWIVRPETNEQRKRAKANGYLPQSNFGKTLQNAFAKKTGKEEYNSDHDAIFRSRKEQFVDYAIALKNGLKWTSDMAFFGLLDEERSNGLE